MSYQIELIFLGSDSITIEFEQDGQRKAETLSKKFFADSIGYQIIQLSGKTLIGKATEEQQVTFYPIESWLEKPVGIGWPQILRLIEEAIKLNPRQDLELITPDDYIQITNLDSALDPVFQNILKPYQ